jgi:hypothetical protein
MNLSQQSLQPISFYLFNSRIRSEFSIAPAQAGLGAKEPSERDLTDLFRHLLARQPAIGLEPAREPEQHPEETECGNRHIDILQLPFIFELLQGAPHEIEIGSLPLIDLPKLSGRQP